MQPPSGCKIPAIRFRNVVLPEPLVPQRAACCSASSEKRGTSTTVWTDPSGVPKLLRRFLIFNSNSARIKFQVSSFKFSLEINTERAEARRAAERNSSFFLLIRGFKKFPVSSGQRRLGHKKSPSKTEGLCNPTWLEIRTGSTGSMRSRHCRRALYGLFQCYTPSA